MSSLLVEPPVGLPQGSEQPRICTFPAYSESSGDEVADFAARYGLVLDPWQRHVLRIAMGERPDGLWSAAEVGLVVPRQNGKGSVLEARELAGLFLLGEELVTHTAHEFKTASDAYRRIRSIVENSPELMRRVKRMPNSPNEKAIELKNGNKLNFIARSGGSGRGFSGDVIILDEAYDLTQDHMDALGPTLTTATNPQVWYTSSAGKSHSLALGKIRKRGATGVEPRLAYMEWSVEDPDEGDPALDPDDLQLIAQANPGFGTRFGLDYLALERGMLSHQGRLRERLGIFDPIVGDDGVFGEGVWERLLDADSHAVGPVTFAVEVAEDRSFACIAAAGVGPSGVLHVEEVAYNPRADWVLDRVEDLSSRHTSSAVMIRPQSQAGSFVSDLKSRGVRVLTMSPQEYLAACGQFYDLVVNGKLRHLAQLPLDISVRSSMTKPSGDGWVWDMRKPDTDISPLIACTTAAWGHREYGSVDVSGQIW